MTVHELLAELEDRTDAERMRIMVGLGRSSRSETDATALIAVLRVGSFYERRLALLSCSGSLDGGHALEALQDSSRLIRGLAINLIPRLCSDVEVLKALETTSQRSRVVLLRKLLKKGRHVPVDAFVERLAIHSVRDVGPLLTFALEGTVKRLLPLVQDYLGFEDWTRLSWLHPNIVADALEERSGSSAIRDARLRAYIDSVLPKLVRSTPNAAMSLVKSSLSQVSVAELELQGLADRLPNEISQIILTTDSATDVEFETLAPKLSVENLLALVKLNPTLLGKPARWLQKLPPETRRKVYAVTALGWRNSDGVLDLEVAALLPTDLRVGEGRRHLTLPALATRPERRIPYASLLPWDEAEVALKQSIASPDADMRARALSALIGVARYYRERLDDVLALARVRANEQDPVRMAMLEALVGLPPGRWTSDHLDGLGQVIEDALGAADLSPATAATAERLVVALIPFHPDWAAACLARLTAERGQLYFPCLGDRLSEKDVRRIAPALLPVLISWETREREGYLLLAASSFGRRLKAFPELADILERTVAITPNKYTASQILSILAAYVPDRLNSLAPKLIELDASVVTLPVVYDFLHRHRQELLKPFLGQTAFKGRFSTGRTRFVLPIAKGFDRWTPEAQKTFALTLTQVTRDTARDVPAIQRVIGQLAAMPAIVQTELIDLAGKRSRNAAVRDAALRALARIDGGEGVPVLIEALDDSRARIAIYALRKALLGMAPAEALALLRGVPMAKVTVAKEVVRLIGELKTPDAFPTLITFDAEPLHRDVRVALLRALWDHVEEDAAWPVLERAGEDKDPAIAAGVINIPTSRLSPRAQARLIRLITVLLGHPDPKVRVDTLSRCMGLPVPDPQEVLLRRLLVSVGSSLPDESMRAARAIFYAYSDTQAEAIGRAVHSIRTNRRALKALIDVLNTVARHRVEQMQGVVRAVLQAIADDPSMATLRAETAALCLPWEETVSLLSELSSKRELHAEALMAVVSTVERVRYYGSERLAQMESSLYGSSDASLRRVALAALVALAETASGWNTDRRARLADYQRDPSPLVSGAAQFIFPPDEAI